MNWSLIVSLLVQYLPVALEWLRKLLASVEREMVAAAPEDAVLAIHDVYAAARARMTFLDRMRGRVRILNACERAALKRAPDFALSLRTGAPVPYATTSEYEAMVSGTE